MQRDFGDEVLIAVVAIGVIAFAVVFGIVLSLVGGPTPDVITLTPATIIGEQVATAGTLPAGSTETESATPATSVTQTNGLTAPADSTYTTPPTESLTGSETSTALDTPPTTGTELGEPTEDAASVTSNTPSESATSEPTATDTATDMPTAADTATDVPTATDTATDVPTATDTATDVPTATDTATDVPTETDTATDMPTATDTATDVPTATDTATDVPTATDTATDMPTATETATDAPTATDTATDVPTATDTATDVPTATDTATDVPTATDTATDVPTATDTATDVPTATDTATDVPTATDTATDVPTATDTATQTATSTNTSTPTSTSTETPTPIPTGSLDSDGRCLYPAAYGRYMVSEGDTLDSIAAAAGEPAENLLGANCMSLDAEIIVGDVLYVPANVEATSTPDGLQTPWTSTGCANTMLSTITSPAAGSAVDGEVSIVGTAFSVTFSGYRLEIRSDSDVGYELIRELEIPALGSVLGTIDLTDREPGLYWLRLVVTTGADEVVHGSVCVVPVFAP